MSNSLYTAGMYEVHVSENKVFDNGKLVDTVSVYAAVNTKTGNEEYKDYALPNVIRAAKTLNENMEDIYNEDRGKISPVIGKVVEH
jgi:hypothetical protein